LIIEQSEGKPYFHHKDTKPLRGRKEHKENKDIIQLPFVSFALLCDLCV